MRGCARVVLGAAILLLATAAARAQPSSADPVRLLDVPYLQQTEALCGGAAAAMVMRYWGATGVYAETFAPLVDRTANGIRGEDLLRELAGRGWDARSFRGDASLVQRRLAAGQPVIALIEDRPGTFHYVVVVAWANGRVIHHDPARAPFRVTSEEAFLQAWEASGRWTLLALPTPSLARATDSPLTRGAGSTRTSVCDPLVAEGVRVATAGDHESALRTFAAAADACPRDSAPWREMAGVYAVKEFWKDAASHAKEAVRRDPEDLHAWRILATSSFVTDDTATALDAWNAIGEPTLEIVNVRGLEHTRHSAATAAMRLEPQTLLSRAALAAAARRLAEVPAAQVARVTYRPLESGRAAVDAVMLERPRSPLNVTGLAVMSVRALTSREATMAFANPTGAGDLVAVTWRWWENRPRVSGSYSAPLSMGGVMHMEAYRDEQTYGSSHTREIRQGGNVTLSDWTATSLRWEAGLAFDRWGARGKTIALVGSLDQRLASDRLSIGGRIALHAGGLSTWTSSAALEWRSTTRREGHAFLARTGAELSAPGAPLALWAGAGLGRARPTLLRAHPLLEDGVVAGAMFGRRLYSASGEWRRWLKPIKGTIRLAPALFIDSARAERRLDPGDAWAVDAGAGLRIAIPGSQVLRIDVAKGLRDGKTVFSVGWTAERGMGNGKW